MAGGPSTVDLVSEASKAGALGSMGAAYTSPAGIKEFVHQVRAKTDEPFAINLFVPHPLPNVNSAQIEKAQQATKSYRKLLNLPPPQIQPPYEEDFAEQFAQVLEIKPAAFSFIFGALDPEKIRAVKQRGIFLIGTATCFDEASVLEASKVDAITLQGFEAGGHRGVFDANAEDPQIGIYDLLKECVSKIKIPLIAAGGIMNSTDVRRALNAGAQAVQMGTAFLLCKEAGTSIPYRTALLPPNERRTKTTRVFSGRLARGIENRFLKEMELLGSDAVLPFPIQNKFTRDLRTASAQKNSSDFLSLWAGTGQGPLWEGACAELINRIFAEVNLQ